MKRRLRRSAISAASQKYSGAIKADNNKKTFKQSLFHK
jgi:hypothetical protein